MKSLSVIGLFINSNLFIAKIINEMYFVRICSNHHSSTLGKKTTKLTNNLYQIKFSWSDIFTSIKIFCCSKLCCRPKEKVMKRSEIIFSKGYGIVQNQMDIV